MLRLVAGIALAAMLAVFVIAQAPAARPTPPARDPNTAGYVTAKELPDGTLPAIDADGNFVIGPTHPPAPEMSVRDDVPHGKICNVTMNSAESRIYPGIARDPGTFGTPDPADPAKLVVTTSHPAPYTRHVAVYVPQQYVAGTTAPLIVGADGPDQVLFTILDNLIANKRVPAAVAVSIGNGSGDAQGSERGLEYDTMWTLCGVCGVRGSGCGGKGMRRETHQGSGVAGSHGRKFRRSGSTDHGLVPHGAVPPRARLLGNLGEPAVAAE